jgi:hypothetical protein
VNGETYWVEITTPYLDRHNDALQIYVRAENGGYVLTDDGYTIHDLQASGCNLTGKRQDLLKMTLSGFGVKLRDEALEVQSTADTFPLKKHSLVQAMLAVNDLFYLAALESVEHRGCCNRLILEANNESLRAENGRLNAALVRISAIRHAVSGAAEAANYALEIADKALAEKPAPEVSHD